MKAKLILVNFCASWAGLSIDTEHSPLWACLLAVAWFFVSGSLFVWATHKGYYKKIGKRFKIDEL